MKENEAIRYLEKFLSGKEIHCAKTNYEYLQFVNLFTNLKAFEAPDFFIKDGDTIWILEHFEIDGSRHDKKGSENKKKQNSDEKKAKEFFKQNPKSDIFNSSLNVKNTSQQYLSNLFLSFECHYGKIENYKANIKQTLNTQKEVVFKIIFLIEDTTVFGTFYHDKDGIHSLLPINSTEFMNYVRGLANIDGLICSSELIKKPHYYTYLLLKDDFESNKVQEKHFLNIELETLPTFSIYGNIKIPKL